jgi:hypothetical protein
MKRSRRVMLVVWIVVNFLSVCVSKWSILKISCRILSASRHLSHFLHPYPTTKQRREACPVTPRCRRRAEHPQSRRHLRRWQRRRRCRRNQHRWPKSAAAALEIVTQISKSNASQTSHGTLHTCTASHASRHLLLPSQFVEIRVP